jgi:heptosyltransferase-2
MSGSSASVSAEAPARVLVAGLNWLGDAIMSMPALQALRAALPAPSRLDLLVKPKLAGLWRLHAAPDRVLTLEGGNLGPFRTGTALRADRYDRCVVLPNSIRSAIAPWWAGIPERTGSRQWGRRWMLTRRIDLTAASGREHQAYEMYRLMDLPPPATLPFPELRLPEAARARAAELAGGIPRPLVALIPGAARGPSKQWPEEHFAALAGRLQRERGAGLVWLGAEGDAALCGRLAAAHGGLSLAGQTPLDVFAALLARADLVVANDSGGMHLAAATGAPTIGLFGVTDPARTGPLGPRVRVLQHSAVRSRNVARDSEAGRAALAAITPDEVMSASEDLLAAPA